MNYMADTLNAAVCVTAKLMEQYGPSQVQRIDEQAGGCFLARLASGDMVTATLCPSGQVLVQAAEPCLC